MLLEEFLKHCTTPGNTSTDKTIYAITMALMSLSLEYEFPWNWEDDAVNDVEDMEIFKEKEVTTSGEETTTENPDFEDDNGSGEENNFEEEGTGIAQLSGFISFLNTSALPEIPPAPTPKVLRHQLDLLEDIHMESIKFYLFAFLPAEIRYVNLPRHYAH